MALTAMFIIILSTFICCYILLGNIFHQIDDQTSLMPLPKWMWLVGWPILITLVAALWLIALVAEIVNTLLTRK